MEPPLTLIDILKVKPLIILYPLNIKSSHRFQKFPFGSRSVF